MHDQVQLNSYSICSIFLGSDSSLLILTRESERNLRIARVTPVQGLELADRHKMIQPRTCFASGRETEKKKLKRASRRHFFFISRNRFPSTFVRVSNVQRVDMMQSIPIHDVSLTYSWDAIRYDTKGVVFRSCISG